LDTNVLQVLTRLLLANLDNTSPTLFKELASLAPKVTNALMPLSLQLTWLIKSVQLVITALEME
jgi:hypothetical protein